MSLNSEQSIVVLFFESNFHFFSLLERRSLKICRQPATWNLEKNNTHEKKLFKELFTSCKNMREDEEFYLLDVLRLHSIFFLFPAAVAQLQPTVEILFLFLLFFFVLCPSIVDIVVAGCWGWNVGFAVVYLPSRFPRETWRIGKRFNAIWWDYVSGSVVGGDEMMSGQGRKIFGMSEI